MKRIALCLLLSLVPLLALAQADGQPPPPVQAVAKYLELSPEQADAWRVLMDNLRAQQQPLADQMKALEEQLKAALQAPAPDPAAVGALVVNIHALRGQMRVNEEAYRAAFEVLLNEGQLKKLYVLRAASKLAPLFPAFAETRLL